MENGSVLVLDHDPVSLLAISDTLAKFNFKVLPFQAAEEALDSLERGVVKGQELDLVVAEVHPANTANETLVVFHQILEAFGVPFVTMCAYDDVEAVSERMTLGSCFNVLKPFGTETVNILLHKARQHKSKRVLPEGTSIPKKTQGRMDSSSAKNHRSETEGEEPYVFKAHSSKKLCRFTWTSKLHERFLRAVQVLGEFATPRNIRRYMNVNNLNLTLGNISSHLQKHRLREQKAKQKKEEPKKYAGIKKLSNLITSSHKEATPEPINHLMTTQRQITHGVASATWDKYPGNPWAQVEERSPEEVFKTCTCRAAVSKRPAMSVWDKYEESLQCSGESPPRRISLTYQPKALSLKSKAVDGYGGIAYVSPIVAGETGYGAPASVPLESSDQDSMITSLLQQLKDTSHTEAAVNNVNLVGLQACCYTMNQVHTAVNVHKDTINQVRTTVAPLGNTMNGVHAAVMVADGLVNLGSNDLLDGTGSSHSTAEKTPSDSVCSWEETEAFLMSLLEGEEQEGIGPGDLPPVDDAWKQMLQPVNVDVAPVAQTGDAPAAAQEPSTGNVLAYDSEFSIGDVLVWSPQFAGDLCHVPF
ncbi:uncharacterized protein LOC124697701 [Lolium rigidum]|uniref:uncharacterized protein LOC124697701 n=1 Tax=Lolium rigidum TaxID=89674 RepID=UPI001F5C17F9|nr:uncharacterized protein LOC124697701 [Lolium rigidum]XP_047086211.1 uncharacterized protein LOC124697701 [Lolium rigidum]XP_047086219.1 uncharacterized protein LOC124697701 [Lolium rigidum]XP_047086226.1 uncharacterized protein LOC124697701 [Lolium rigidum]XP_047086232.1 uncharacterized protein LOC124697701 [Lolium rigidum]